MYQVCTCGYGTLYDMRCPIHDPIPKGTTTSTGGEMQWIEIPGGSQEFFSGQQNLDIDLIE